ncbi:hypothetical protein B0I35DRAFT_464726 [Stachybotrys elegans]|uniref:Secreted protein n=1 Tax=Stachybotrys elegans TaxID=80388 RepID=A0A8K0SJE3_9HYPO|nr:hypothetical protein B0I35DRAFT_464726 [Stachybotrys elegans]
MISTQLAKLLLAVTAVSAATVPIANNVAPIPGYGVEDFQWEVQALPGGPFLNFTGTLEHVHDEVLQLNPNFDADFPVEKGAIHARTDFGGSAYNCDTNRWGLADKGRIQGGISYLRRVAGRPSNGPGPGNCGRVSCSNDAAIWWCNDSPSTKELASFSSIADGAQYIVDRCSFYNGYGTYASGQVFHSTNWNVITSQANC